MHEYTISDKPADPAHAFGLTFSPRSQPPPHIVQKARPFVYQPPPPPSPPLVEPPAISPPSPKPEPDVSPPATEALPVPQSPPPKAPVKSWASLFPKPPTPSTGSSSSPNTQLQSAPNGLPSVSTSTFSYSAASSTPMRQYTAQPKIDPHALLTQPPISALIQPTPLIHPRGLVNAGNLCFANSILQALVHCPPLWRVIVEGIGPVFEESGVLSANHTNGKHSTALLETMLLFVKEFKLASEVDVPTDPKPGEALKNAFVANGKKKPSANSSPGTPLTIEQLRRKSFLQDPFLPEFLWDALRENKRFDSMTTGQQEDAEEFLGFFLDTLHEELLFVLERLSVRPPASLTFSQAPRPQSLPRGRKGKKENGLDSDRSKGGGPSSADTEAETRELSRPLSPGSYENGHVLTNSNDDDGWVEIGKGNKVSVTRTTQSTESVITRIFGGKLRSILKIPGANKDSVTLEPYQALQLDITPDHVESVEDALKNLTQPETVSIHSTSKGYDVPATKQVFIDTVPPILILHLKRFIYDMSGGVQKSQKEVSYEPRLELSKEVLSPSKRDGPPVIYQLYGVVYHHGKFTSGGHYTIDLLRQDHSEWLRMDDTLIEPVPEDDVVIRRNTTRIVNPRTGIPDKVAYLLFYQRMN